MLLPELPEGVSEAVRQMSIRGRMALGARCFDDACAHFGLDGAEIQALSDSFWSFTSAMDLGEWEAGIPPGITDAHELMLVTVNPGIARGPSWSDVPDAASRVPPVFLRMPLGLVVMAVLIYDDIGRGNLYSGVVHQSPETWQATLRMLSCVRQMGLPLPGLAPFLRSAITEDGGWGHPRPREFFTA
jgi:hypothetical protein